MACCTRVPLPSKRLGGGTSHQVAVPGHGCARYGSRPLFGTQLGQTIQVAYQVLDTCAGAEKTTSLWVSCGASKLVTWRGTLLVGKEVIPRDRSEQSVVLFMNAVGCCELRLVFQPMDRVFRVSVRAVEDLSYAPILGAAFCRANGSQLSGKWNQKTSVVRSTSPSSTMHSLGERWDTAVGVAPRKSGGGRLCKCASGRLRQEFPMVVTTVGSSLVDASVRLGAHYATVGGSPSCASALFLGQAEKVGIVRELPGLYQGIPLQCEVVNPTYSP